MAYAKKKKKKKKKPLSTGKRIAIAGGTLLGIGLLRNAPAIAQGYRAGRFGVAEKAYHKAGGTAAPKKLWDAYVKHGDKYVGKYGDDVLRSEWARNKAGLGFQAAEKAYYRAGDVQAPKKLWDALLKSGDRYAGTYGDPQLREAWAKQKGVLGSTHSLFSRHKRALGRVDELLPGLREAKTRPEALKIFQAAGRKYHPDMGGSKEKFQQMQEAWDAFNKGYGQKPVGLALPPKTAGALSFYEEIEKIGQDVAAAEAAADKPVTFRAPFAAHEMGHATDFEGRRAPKFREAVERGLWLGGKGASLLAQARGRPFMAAAGQLLAGAPEVYSEGVASVRGFKAMRESGKYTPEELKQARRSLMWAGGTYVAPRVIDAAAAAGIAEFTKRRPDVVKAISDASAEDPRIAVGLLGASSVAKWIPKALVGAGLEYGAGKSVKKAPPMTPAEAEALRKQMNVRAQIYKAKPKEIGENALYLPGGQLPDDKETFKDLKKGFGELLTEPISDQQLKTMLGEGGIILPGMVKKGEKGEKEKKPSWIKGVAKGVGLGATTLGTAAALIAASDPKSTKKLIGRLRRRGVSKLGSVPHGRLIRHEKTANAHWSSLAQVLVKPGG